MGIGINNLDSNTALFNMQGNKLQSLNNSALNKSEQGNDDKLKKASKDFEAVFVKQFMDIMQSTVDKGDFMHGGQAEETFQSMLNDEMAKNISSSPHTSFGFAEQIYKQLKNKG